jgi:hypothetical protein
MFFCGSCCIIEHQQILYGLVFQLKQIQKVINMAADIKYMENIIEENTKPKISKNLNIPRKPFVLQTCAAFVLQTCAATCLLLYLSTVSQPTGIFISAHVSEFWLFS